MKMKGKQKERLNASRVVFLLLLFLLLAFLFCAYGGVFVFLLGHNFSYDLPYFLQKKDNQQRK